ncbi:hypothetical protein H4582DRAFT_2056079 [Lactarius indigo]|nr:hypothetical protein H4582DRAFT_2056079 [Lactarius indigo]
MLAALYIVLDAKGDLSEIDRGHPSIYKHKYYLPSAVFPTNISHLLPLSEGCWWEHLAAKHGDGGVPPGNAVPSPMPPPPPPPLPPCRHLLKVTLIMGPPPEDSEDEMEVDQLEESRASLNPQEGQEEGSWFSSYLEEVQNHLTTTLKELGNSVKDASRPMCTASHSQWLPACTAKAVSWYHITQHKVWEGMQPVAAYRKMSEASDLAALASRLVEGLTLYSMSSNAVSPASLSPIAADSPISPNPSATETTATTTTTAAAGPSTPAAAASAADATPVITPSLHQCLQPAQCLVPVVEVPMPSHLALSSSQQCSGASAAQAPQEVPEHNSANKIQHLEMRLADVEEKLEVLMKGGGA